MRSLNPSFPHLDNRLLDEESFVNALKEDQGRATNLSLFDEIRLSFSHSMSRPNFTEIPAPCDKCNDLDASTTTVETQTEVNTSEVKDTIDTGIQTDELGHNCECLRLITVHTQTEDVTNNNDSENCLDCPKCVVCEILKRNIQTLEDEKKHSQNIVKETQEELSKYETNLNMLQKLVSDGNGRNSFLQAAVDSLQTKIMLLEAACSSQKEIIEGFSCEMCCAQIQTDCGNCLCY